MLLSADAAQSPDRSRTRHAPEYCGRNRLSRFQLSRRRSGCRPCASCPAFGANPRCLGLLGRAAAILLAWSAILLVAARGRPILTLRDRSAEAALPPGVRAGLGAAVLGLVLAAGVRLGPPDRRAARLRLRLRHAARLVAARHAIRSASGRFRSSSASTCSCGSSRTGSTCSS